MSYIALADLRQYQSIGAGKTADDATLTRLCAVVQQSIDHYTGRTFEASSDTTRYFDGILDVDGRTLRLDADLCEIASIANGNGQAVVSTQYTTEPRNVTPWYAISLRRASTAYWMWITDPADAISITGRWAYSKTAPEDIVQAALRWATYFYRQADAQVFDVTSDPNTGQLHIPKGMPKDVQDLLMPYRRRSL